MVDSETDKRSVLRPRCPLTLLGDPAVVGKGTEEKGVAISPERGNVSDVGIDDRPWNPTGTVVYVCT